MKKKFVHLAQVLLVAASALSALSVMTAGASTEPAAEHAAGAKTEAPAKPAIPTYTEKLERGKQIASTVCVACHGLEGFSPIPANPNLAGMPAEYIAKQLELFKSGKRANSIMMGMSTNLSHDDMNAVGAYYFAQRGNTGAIARDEKLAKRGQQIYRIGIADAKVPACAGCHGAAGAGIPSIYPRLAGQWSEYTLAQLKAYASGERKNTQMNAIAARLKDSDLQAVAEYLAGMRSVTTK